jgi:hypothetical protein
MPWCPKCKSEYKEGFAKCADCDIELVEALSPDKWINDKAAFLVEASNDLEADIIEALLTSNQIQVMREYREYSHVLSEYSWLGVKIFVPSKKFEVAKQILEFDEKKLEEELELESEEAIKEIQQRGDVEESVEKENSVEKEKVHS